jgi:2-polyprenyl-6-methoxyphenol hydroxylase-like FAD-dependent oxidoreductase
VLGADGLRSRVHASLFGHVALRYAGQTTFRALVPFELPPPFARKGIEIWGGPIRFGFASTKPDEVYYFCVFDAPAGTSHSAEEARGLMLGRLGAFPAVVRDLVEATSDAALLQTDLHDFKPLACWSVGPIGLIGDAAHATTPNLGQGGAQALEDAYHLDACVDSDSGRIDLERFYRMRRTKTARITNQSFLFGKLAHARRFTGLRDLILRSTPPRMTLRQTARIYRL